MGFVELEGSAGAEVLSAPLGLCRLLVAEALSFHLVLPSLTTLTPHHDGTQGLRSFEPRESVFITFS